jgi:hypothetical protein
MAIVFKVKNIEIFGDKIFQGQQGQRGQHRYDACRTRRLPLTPAGKDAMHRVSATQPDRSAFRTGVGAAPDLTGSADLSGSIRITGSIRTIRIIFSCMVIIS